MEFKHARAIGLTILLSLLPRALAAGQASAPATRPSGPERWEERIAAFEARDRAAPPLTGAVLFVGSSSIAGWTLEEFFPGLQIAHH